MGASMPARSEAAGRRRNPRGQGQQLRSEIVAAAHVLLDEAGEEAVTLRAVARRIGISAPSIYAHFADRDAILLAVATDAFAELAEYLRAARDDSAVASGAEQATAVCAAYLRFARERPVRYRVMFGGVWNATRAIESRAVTIEEVTALGAEALAVIADALARRDDGEDASRDKRAAATVVWVGLHGLAHQRLVAPGFPWPPDVEPRLISALIGVDS